MDELDEVRKAIHEISNEGDSKKTIDVLTDFFEEERKRFFYSKPQIKTSIPLEGKRKKETIEEVEWTIEPRPKRELFPKKEERNYVSRLSRSYNNLIREQGIGPSLNPANEPRYSNRLPMMRSTSIGYNS